MVKLKPLSRLLLCGAAAAVTIGIAGPVLAGTTNAKPPRLKATSAEAPSTAPKFTDFAKLEALRSVVVAFIGERECDDLSVDYSRLDRRLRQAGLKPEDVGPRSAYGEQLDLLRREVLDTFLDNRRRACEQAWDAVGKNEAAEQAPSAARLSQRPGRAAGSARFPR
ncbi:MAG TPA: hypothetical protein VGU24_19970 [Microvirga sp.]|jgi:hypothetical protein|nr:hypothetical protein [Microvirga sp.]